MIAVDSNVLIRFLVRDDELQAQAARKLLESLTSERKGFVCREVTIEVVWVLTRAYGFARDQIANTLEELVCTKHIIVEAAADVVRAANHYRSGNVGFADLMIAAAAARVGASPVYTFDRKAAPLEGVRLI